MILAASTCSPQLVAVNSMLCSIATKVSDCQVSSYIKDAQADRSCRTV